MDEIKKEKSPRAISSNANITKALRMGYNQASADCTLALTKKLDGLEEVILESSLCHLCLSNVEEGKQEIGELVEIIKEYIMGG